MKRICVDIAFVPLPMSKILQSNSVFEVLDTLQGDQ